MHNPKTKSVSRQYLKPTVEFSLLAGVPINVSGDYKSSWNFDELHATQVAI